MATAGREKLHSLQSLRAVAAIVVLVFHVCNNGAMGLNMAPWALFALKIAADCAVDAFFVLSGFIMVYTQTQAQRGAVDFARARVERIVPLYWATTALFVVFVLTGEPTLRQAVAHFQMTRNYTAASALFISHLFGYKFPMVLPGWSLEYEMLFYALFTGAILISKRHTVAVVTAMLAALTVAGLLRPLCLEFACGAAVGVLYFRGWHRPLAGLMLLLAPAVVVAGLFTQAYPTVNDNDWARVAFCGVPMLALFLVTLCAAQARRPALAMLGDCSYAIYLTHCLWLGVYVRYFLPLMPKWGGSALVASTGIAWCLAGGVAMHYLVEKKLDGVLRAVRKRTGARAVAGTSAAVV
ncbi:MAG: acyltransferase [Sphingomonadales bacterium]|nr:acyltransferase [Sphingomonadales bacterium]